VFIYLRLLVSCMSMPIDDSKTNPGNGVISRQVVLYSPIFTSLPLLVCEVEVEGSELGF
jgi:hypothetical protein